MEEGPREDTQLEGRGWCDWCGHFVPEDEGEAPTIPLIDLMPSFLVLVSLSERPVQLLWCGFCPRDDPL